MKKMLILLLTLCLLLAACAPANDTPDTSKDPNQGISNPNPADPDQDIGNPNLPEDPRLAAFNTLFGDLSSWYNRALTSLFATPTQIALDRLFYNGFPGESRTPTDAEWEKLKDQPGFDINLDLHRLPADKMNQVLTQYFGITLENVEANGFKGLVYLEGTNCYYRMGTDVALTENFAAVRIEDMDDGTIRLYYTANSLALGNNGAGVVTLKSVDNQWQILSNQKA